MSILSWFRGLKHNQVSPVIEFTGVCDPIDEPCWIVYYNTVDNRREYFIINEEDNDDRPRMFTFRDIESGLVNDIVRELNGGFDTSYSPLNYDELEDALENGYSLSNKLFR